MSDLSLLGRIRNWFFAPGAGSQRRGGIPKEQPPRLVTSPPPGGSERIPGSELRDRLYGYHNELMRSAYLLRAGIISKSEHQGLINQIRAAEGLLPIVRPDEAPHD